MRTKQHISLFLVAALCLYGCTTENNYYQTLEDIVDGENENAEGGDYVEDVCVYMTDANFREYCRGNFDTDKDGMVSSDEAKAVLEIDCSTAEDFTGVEYFPNLLAFTSNSAKTLDLAKNAMLMYIMLWKAPIEELDLSKNTNLKTLYDSGLMRGSLEACENLTSIVLPENIPSIENFAFYSCTSLPSITIPESVTSIGGYAFWKCTSLSGITIPEGVTSIEEYTFYFCTNISSIYIPAGVTSIGGYAFENCTSLTSISLPESLTEIGWGGFWGCNNLSEVQIKALTPPTLGAYAFYDIDSLAILYVPSESVEAYKNSDWAQYFNIISALQD